MVRGGGGVLTVRGGQASGRVFQDRSSGEPDGNRCGTGTKSDSVDSKSTLQCEEVGRSGEEVGGGVRREAECVKVEAS